MRTMQIVRDNDQYATWLKRSPVGGMMYENELRATPADTYILTGNKTGKDAKTGRDWGTGPSPYGFVLSAGRVLGRVNLEHLTARGSIVSGWLKLTEK